MKAERRSAGRMRKREKAVMTGEKERCEWVKAVFRPDFVLGRRVDLHPTTDAEA